MYVKDFWFVDKNHKIGNDTPPNSLMDSTMNLKGENNKRIRSWACSLARNTLKVEGHARALGWGLRSVTSTSIIHTDLHKPNNKLVSV